MLYLHKLARRYRNRALRTLDIVGAFAITTRVGAIVVGELVPGSRPLICTHCLSDRGLRMNAERVAIPHALPCPHCGMRGTHKLTRYLIRQLARQFFVRGSVYRPKEGYGAAPLVQYNERQFQRDDYKGTQSLKDDVALLSEKGRIGFFHYGPNLWMLGEVEPLKALQNRSSRKSVIDRILEEYPERILPEDAILYRLRKDPYDPTDNFEYDSPPREHLGCGRLDSKDLPVFIVQMT